MREDYLELIVSFQDPEIQKYTGKTDRIDVMSALREAKNSM
jgi:hydroxyacylglutathione hydrolase